MLSLPHLLDPGSIEFLNHKHFILIALFSQGVQEKNK